jgi:sugar phosphate isomerase/epimerase
MAKPISVQLYSVREAAAKDFPGTLKKIADMGYAGVEYAGLHGHAPGQIAKLVKDLGMVSSSAHVGIPTKENINQLVDEAKILGYSYLISGFGPDDVKTADGVKACIDKFAKGCDLVKPHGLRFGMHNHWWEFDHTLGGKTPYEMILSAVPAMVSELDIYWSTRGGADTSKVVKTWASRIPLLHIKDGDLTDRIVHKAVGDGKVPTRAIIEAADPKVLEWLVVELDACDTDMLEAVAKSCKWLVSNGLAKGRK